MATSSGKFIILAGAAAFLAAVADVNFRALTKISLPDYSGLLDGRLTAEFERQYRDIIFFKSSATNVFGVLRFFAFGEGRKGVIVGRDGWLFSTEELERPAGYEERAARRVAEVAHTVRDLQAGGAHVVVALVPEKADIYGDMLPAGRGIVPNLSYDVVRSELLERGVVVPDLRLPLLEERRQQSVFLRTDTHWTPAGAAAAARIVAEAVALPDLRGSKSYSAVNGAPVRVDGDLMHYVSLGGLDSMAGLSPDEVSPPVVEEAAADVAAGDLFGDASIAVNLLGTSYSANETWGFASSLKRYLGADVLNLAEVGQGPFQPMATYLRDGMFRKSTPRLVIWEIPLRYFAVSPPQHKSPADTPVVSASVNN